MGKMDLQCLFIGRKPRSYKGLLEIIYKFDCNLRVKEVSEEKQEIIKVLKNFKRSISIVFISDQTSLSLYTLSDLIWQHSPETIVIILTEKVPSIFFKNPLNNIVLARLNIKEVSNESQLFLGSLLQITQLKNGFRQCKRLLGVSEKRCQRLVDSSCEAIAYISHDLHLYANSAYLELFEVDSVQQLRSLPVQELFGKNEYILFEHLISNQNNLPKSLLTTMHKRNGATIRARVMTIPSVLKGELCLQLWVRPLEGYVNKQDNIDESSIDKMERLMNQQERKRQASYHLNNSAKSIIENHNRMTSLEVLKGVIKRKEVKLSARKMINMKTQGTDVDHYIISLKTPVSLKIGIEKLLFYPVTEQSKIAQISFWDKVKLVKLIQFMIVRKELNKNLIIRLNTVSVSNKAFVRWFVSSFVKAVGVAPNVIFMFSLVPDNKKSQSAKFISKVRVFDSKICLDEFSLTKDSIAMLRQAKPDYVRLSPSWIKSIEGNESREIALASFIRQVESKKIKVIAPCGVSESIRRLFTLSGVSFCQEIVI